MRLLLPTIVLVLLLPSTVSGDEDRILWETREDDTSTGEWRTGTFEVPDRACAYNFMADVRLLEKSLTFLEKVDLHEDRGTWQDATYHERFFLVGLVQSRFHRTIGAGQVSWKLVDGMQKRHDGTWRVTPTEGGAQIAFDNLIEAKRRIHNGLLRRVQKRTMSDIANRAIEVCGG